MSIIGIIPDYQNSTADSSACYRLHVSYTKAIEKAGGIPLILPYESKEEALSICSGLLFTGGGHTLDPQLFGQTFQTTLSMNPVRCEFEIHLFKQAYQKKMPILGICAGAQLMNVALGGSLIQHLPTTHPQALLHAVGDPWKAAHPIHIQSQTHLSSLSGGQTEFVVNTSHLQAVDRLGEGLVCNALAPDGIIEGIESTEHPFCLGTQWHPERTVALDDKIFYGFIAACQTASLQNVA